MTATVMEKPWSTEKVAAFLEVKPQFVRNLVAKRMLIPIGIGRRPYKFDVEQVHQLLKSWKTDKSSLKTESGAKPKKATGQVYTPKRVKPAGYKPLF